MNNTETHFKSFPKLAESASGFIGVLIPGPYQSLPVPARYQGRLLVAFMFCLQVVMPKPNYMLFPPNKVGWVDPVSGERLGLIQVSPSDFHQADPIDKNFPTKQLNKWLRCLEQSCECV